MRNHEKEKTQEDKNKDGGSMKRGGEVFLKDMAQDLREEMKRSYVKKGKIKVNLSFYKP